MPELFQEMYYGPNVQNLVESDDCKVMRLSDNSGEGMMTLYHVFPGVFLMYNDFHMKECVSGFQTDMDLLCIDHCREGRIEQEVGQNAFSYLEAGDLRVDRRIHHSGKVEFPLSHYHGISIGFQMETAAKEIPASMPPQKRPAVMISLSDWKKDMIPQPVMLASGSPAEKSNELLLREQS